MLIAVLVGFAISRGPEKPRVAFLNEVPQTRGSCVGGQKLPRANVQGRICQKVECVQVDSNAGAEDKVASGDVLAALILPEDLINKINSLSTLTPGTPEVEVIVNEEDPIKAGLVNDRITSLMAQANLAIARRIATEGSHYLKPGDRGRQPAGAGVEGPHPRPPGERPHPRSAGAGAAAGPLRSSLGEVTEFADQAAKTSTSPGR